MEGKEEIGRIAVKIEPGADQTQPGSAPPPVSIKEEEAQKEDGGERPRKRKREADGEARPKPPKIFKGRSPTLAKKGEEEEEKKKTDTLRGRKMSAPQRSIGDEEQNEIDKLSAEIGRIEKEIKGDASAYEQCRRVLSMGVTSVVAVEQATKMDALLQKLAKLKEDRHQAMYQKDKHLIQYLQGDEMAVITEAVRNERSARAKRFPMAQESRTESAEIERRMAAKDEEKKCRRANSANCPAKCRELVEDHVGCVLLCPACGYVYEEQRCNPNNPVCTMGKFGEHADVPRRRSGGYKPPNHFAEIVGYFQGTRNSTAPPEIIERVKDYCFRYRYEPREVTPQVVRFFLRRMQQDENNRHDNALSKNPADRLRRFTDFYRSAPEMAYRLSGIPPPYMSPMQEDRVTALFPLVIAAYKTSPRYLRRMQNRADCIKKFPNNPNYSLVFYKECQLLGYDEFLQYIPLPKSTDNIDDNDTMAWKHICEVNGWPYIPTR